MQVSYSFSNHWCDKKCLKNQAQERRNSIQSTVIATSGTEMHVIWLGLVRYFTDGGTVCKTLLLYL